MACASSPGSQITVRSWEKYTLPAHVVSSIFGIYCVGSTHGVEWNMGSKILHEGFTFDDVLIRPAASSIEPAEATLHTTVAAGLDLKYPFLSAAMDRVTDSKMAIALGKMGALG